MPVPKEGEAKEAFVERCIPVVLDDGTAESNDQAYAICVSLWDEAQPQGNWFRVAINEIAPIKHQSVDDTEYLVAPIVLIREGVLNGELARAKEFQRHYGAWNGRPFVIGHPMDKDGFPLSANNPLILAGQHPDICGGLKVGELYNTEPIDGGLNSEIWMPIERVRNKGGDALRVLDRLERGERLEISTAYWRDLESGEGEWQGAAYNGTQHHFKPDHVAALLDSLGACDWEMGCGAPRMNEEDGMEVNVLGSARRPTFSKKSSASWSKPSLKDFGVSGDVAELSAEDKSRIAKTSLLGDPKADDFRNLCFFPVVSPGGALNENALMAVLGGRGAQANIPAEAKASAQRMARRLLNEEFDRDLETEEAQNNVRRILSVIANLIKGETQTNEPVEEVEQVDEREQLIEKLLAETEFSENDLEGMSDCGLKALAALIEEPEPGPVEPEEEPAVNEPEEEEFVSRADYDQMLADMAARIDALADEVHQDEQQRHNALVQSLVANDRCAVSEDKLAAMDIETLEALEQSLVPADYTGAGGGPQDNGRDWVVYDRALREVANG